MQDGAHQIFYDAALVALQAAQEFALRYAALALEMAAQCDDAVHHVNSAKSGQLPVAGGPSSILLAAGGLVSLRSAANQVQCQQLLAGAAQSVPVALFSGKSRVGRFRPSRHAGVAECLWLKFNEIVLLRSSHSARYFAGFPIGFLTLSGRPTPRRGQRHESVVVHVSARPGSWEVQRSPISRFGFMREPGRVFAGVGLCHRQRQRHAASFQRRGEAPGQLARGMTAEDAGNYAVVGCVEL